MALVEQPSSGPIYCNLSSVSEPHVSIREHCCRRHEQETKAKAMAADFASHDFSRFGERLVLLRSSSLPFHLISAPEVVGQFARCGFITINRCLVA